MASDPVEVLYHIATSDYLCCLCLKPIRPNVTMRYMGRDLGIRNVWCHGGCWDARYHGAVHGKQEPQEKQAGLWEVSDAAS